MLLNPQLGVSLTWQLEGHPNWWARDGVLWSWCGLVGKWALGDDSLPPPIGCNLASGRDYQGLETASFLRPFLPAVSSLDQSAAEIVAPLALRLVSYNALSLVGCAKGPAEEGLAQAPARAAMLAKQLVDHKVQCAAIQEARTAEGFDRTGGFLRFRSGAQKGHFGVELWFKEAYHVVDYPVSSTTGPVVFKREAFVALHRDPRRILILFKQGSLQIVFASLHAPHRGNPADVLDKWWGETENILCRESRGRLLVVGADCNAALGSVPSAAVSDAEAEEQDHAGGCLHSVLHKCELWAPATWPAHQVGPGWTFMQRRNGALSRPDFILLPESWKAGEVQAWTEAGITAANLVIDHLATAVDVHLCVRCGPGPPKDQRGRIDARALTCADNREKLRAILQDAPRPAWEINAHSHVAVLTGTYRKSLLRLFRHRGGALCTPSCLQRHGTYKNKFHGSGADARRCVRSCADTLPLPFLLLAWKGPVRHAPFTYAAWLIGKCK